MTQRFVLDAWALLALLQGEEPAASRVSQLLQNAQEGAVELFISVINLGEVVYRIGRVKGEAEARETLDQIRQSPLVVVPATEEVVLAAAGLKMHYPISYADAFTAATADQLSGILVTGDPELEQLASRVRIEKLERGAKT